MENKKSIWTSITGGVTSAVPILFACCKGGACVGVCVTPIASIFGISAATIAASPVTAILEPLFIALSAVSFTVSYYSLYVIPKMTACGAGNNCACGPDDATKKKVNFSKLIFWLGIVLSIGFISYFEYSKYSSAASIEACSPSGCGETASTGCSAPSDSTCCASDTTVECSSSSEGEACCEKKEE